MYTELNLKTSGLNNLYALLKHRFVEKSPSLGISLEVVLLEFEDFVVSKVPNMRSIQTSTVNVRSSAREFGQSFMSCLMKGVLHLDHEKTSHVSFRLCLTNE